MNKRTAANQQHTVRQLLLSIGIISCTGTFPPLVLDTPNYGGTAVDGGGGHRQTMAKTGGGEAEFFGSKTVFK